MIRTLHVLTTGMPETAYRTLRPLLRIFPTYYLFRHKISDWNLETGRSTVNAALDRIEQERQGPHTLSAMLSPLPTSRPQRCWGPYCSHPKSSTRCASISRRICRTTALRWCSIRPRSGRPASTGCIAVTPRKFCGDRLPRKFPGPNEVGVKNVEAQAHRVINDDCLLGVFGHLGIQRDDEHLSLRLWCPTSKPIFDLSRAMNTSTRSVMK
jgi:hypothetical protein